MPAQAAPPAPTQRRQKGVYTVSRPITTSRSRHASGERHSTTQLLPVAQRTRLHDRAPVHLTTQPRSRGQRRSDAQDAPMHSITCGARASAPGEPSTGSRAAPLEEDEDEPEPVAPSRSAVGEVASASSSTTSAGVGAGASNRAQQTRTAAGKRTMKTWARRMPRSYHAGSPAQKRSSPGLVWYRIASCQAPPSAST